METHTIGDVVLKADDVTVTFGAVKALTGVSFEAKEQEILAIIGPNGAGKTTMLNVINGFYHPDSGSITFKGQT
ncbi:MAG: ABC transporter ATP-binding protein, partial [Acidiferrobacteraceae bacterium]|nr:ABC transporter ATP-binding protein [Acidiferrobacteraceae bacterium]